MTTISTATLPIQSIPRSKKDKNWCKQVIDEFDNLTNGDGDLTRSDKFRKQVNYELYNGRLNKDDFLYVLNPYNMDDGEFPANMQHYDIITPKLNLLLGEEAKRPFNYNVLNLNPDMVSKMEQRKRDLLIQVLINKMPHPQGQDPNMPQGPQTPKEIEAYVNRSWKDSMAITGQRVLKYFEHKFNLRHAFNMGFKDAMITSEEIYWVGEVAKDVDFRLCNPVSISVIMDPDENWIQNAEAVVEERWMTVSSVIDEFYDVLTAKDIKQLEAMAGRSGSNGDFGLEQGWGMVKWKSLDFVDTTQRNHDLSGNVRVLRVEWKSIRKVGILNTPDEMGFTRTLLVDESFIVPDYAEKNKKGEWFWTDENGSEMTFKWYRINEVWEGTRIGDDIIVNCKPKKSQRRELDNPSKVKNGYVGYIYSARNSQAVSFVDRAKPFQYLYDIIYYRTELAFAKNKGPIILMDLAQMPKSHGIDMKKWLYYMEAMNVLFVNSTEDMKGYNHAFNQFQVLTAQMTQFINEHIGMLDKIKEELGELVGVSRQRQGQVNTSELVGNTERAVTQSSHITEYWFFFHDLVKQEVLQALLDVSRGAWSEGKTIQYVADDGAATYFQIEGPEFATTQMGIFATNAQKDLRTLDALQQLVQVGLQNGQTQFKDIIGIYQKDNIRELALDLEKSAAEIQQNQMQQAQANQEMEKQRLAQEQQIHLDEREDKALDRQNKIEIALIQAESRNKPEPLEPDSDEPTEMDRAKFELDKKKVENDQRNKERVQGEVERSNRANEGLKKEQLSIQRSKPASSPSSKK